jgi:hypothetical protein
MKVYQKMMKDKILYTEDNEGAHVDNRTDNLAYCIHSSKDHFSSDVI